MDKWNDVNKLNCIFQHFVKYEVIVLLFSFTS